MVCVSGAPSIAQGRRADARLLDRLYQLVWPAGRFKGDLVRTIERNTQKSIASPGNPRLYLVGIENHLAREWPSSAGATEPVVCPSDRTLVYRRGATLVVEPIRVSAAGEVSSGGTPAPLTSPSVTSLVACTTDNAKAVLWIQTPDGEVVSFGRRGSVLERRAIDPKLAAVPAQQLADDLRVMRSLRPDGVTVAVLNRSLVGEAPARKRWRVVDSDALTFFGVPSLVPGTDSVFVVADRKEPS
jgi:hypothetical protein